MSELSARVDDIQATLDHSNQLSALKFSLQEMRKALNPNKIDQIAAIDAALPHLDDAITALTSANAALDSAKEQLANV